MVDPDNSVIRILTRKDYFAMSAQQVQRLLATHHIVVTDYSSLAGAFGKKTLLSLVRDLDSTIGIHGMYFHFCIPNG